MFTVAGIRKLHSWTHASLTVVLDHLSVIPQSDYVKELPGFGFPTLRAQMMHIFNCELFWIHTLQGLPFVDEVQADWAEVSDARALQGKVGANTLAYLSGLANEQLNAKSEVRFPDGETAVRTPALVLHHIFTHAFHHKGQIVTMCRALGCPSPGTDLNQFE
ncbi:MAG TPA: DinB family protein [Acidobacteriaceae bacterium]|nr:DinB family protein [Acidobacteriaceae bacterium]